MEKRIITLLVLVVIIISAFIFIFNKKLIIEKAPTIILNKEEFQKGDGIIAKILIPSVNYYRGSCFSGFSIYFLDENKKWVQKTINQENSECSPYCKNNISLADCGCQQKWSIGQSICFCDKLNSKAIQDDEYFTRFEWDMNFYEYENKSCGNEKGVFKFAKPAPSGQYKIQYTFFDDEECKFENSAEKIFIIK